MKTKQLSMMLDLAGSKLDSSRTLLQFIGTEVMRDCLDPDIHAKIVFQKIKMDKLKNVVIADARFENERLMTRKEGGKLVLIDCVQTREQESSQRSETGLGSHDDYDVVIINNKREGFKAFYDKIEYVMEEVI